MKVKILVTGGTGFLSMHIILQLLSRGFYVRTTLRSIEDSSKVNEVLVKNGINNLNNLEFIEADLLSDRNWDKAMKGCDYVLSISSPVFFEKVRNEDEAIKSAKEGIIRVLKFAKEANIRRVIMTSNYGAIGFSSKDKDTIITEKEWTKVKERGLSVYEKSKLVAEKSAWEYIKENGEGLEFATINPVAIFGPLLNEHTSGSFELIKNLISGKMKYVPNIPLNIVDVRDVVDVHIRAMLSKEANGHRFIVSARGEISLVEIAKIIKKSRPEISSKISDKVMSNWTVHVLGLFNSQLREASLLLRLNRNVSIESANKILSWAPSKTNKEIILLTVDSMVDKGII